MPVKAYEKQQDGSLNLKYTVVTTDDLTTSLNSYVTLSTSQTISGAKTLSNTLTAQSIIPNTADTYDLGSLENPWNNLYIKAINVYNEDSSYADIDFTNKYTTLKIRASGYVMQVKSSLGVAGHIFPIDGENGSLGKDTNKWTDLYLSGNLTDGTNSITIANIQSKLNAGTNIDITNNSISTTNNVLVKEDVLYLSCGNASTNINDSPTVTSMLTQEY